MQRWTIEGNFSEARANHLQRRVVVGHVAPQPAVLLLASGSNMLAATPDRLLREQNEVRSVQKGYCASSERSRLGSRHAQQATARAHDSTP